MGVVTTLKSEHTYVIQLLSLNSVSINEKVYGYEWMLGTASEKIKSKKRDFGPFSLYPYPPTINRDIFDFIFPPTLLIKKVIILRNLHPSKIFFCSRISWAFVQIPTYLYGQSPEFYSLFFLTTSLTKLQDQYDSFEPVSMTIMVQVDWHVHVQPRHHWSNICVPD